MWEFTDFTDEELEALYIHMIGVEKFLGNFFDEDMWRELNAEIDSRVF